MIEPSAPISAHQLVTCFWLPAWSAIWLHWWPPAECSNTSIYLLMSTECLCFYFIVAFLLKIKLTTTNFNIAIATNFFTWHDSGAVVTCANVCCDILTRNGIKAKWNFHRIWIVTEKINVIISKYKGHQFRISVITRDNTINEWNHWNWKTQFYVTFPNVWNRKLLYRGDCYQTMPIKRRNWSVSLWYSWYVSLSGFPSDHFIGKQGC